MCRVLPFPRYPLASEEPWSFAVPVVPQTLVHWSYPIPGEKSRTNSKRRTRIMATLNATPDSFSDGGFHNVLNTALHYAHGSLEGGASIIDIGGYSTRPGAAYVSTQDETSRVVPVVQAIRESDLRTADAKTQLRDIPISIDTFRWEVAEAAILAGANCINDVYAFTGNDTYPFIDGPAKARAEECMVGMKRVAKEYVVPVVLMHSRGDAGQNKDYSMYSDAGSVTRGVQEELGNKVERIVKGRGSVRRWLVVVDPGVGFSKTLDGNLQLLRDGAMIVADTHLLDG
jgi:dihydroneopterin aldolase/2-amino-4-hydroxy-6-hydroxymethyldihydropteridine diphosphokinase/dihydropteroate synthase